MAEEFPRSCDIQRMTKAELMIMDAQREVEKLPASTQQTTATCLLTDARTFAAAIVDGEEWPQTLADIYPGLKPKRSVFWLIEHSGPFYLSADDCSGNTFFWTANVDKALEICKSGSGRLRNGGHKET